jgi:hypothetical protein
VQEENTLLKEAISQEGKEKKKVQKNLDEMEKKINVVFQAIFGSAKPEGSSSEEKIKKIKQIF